MPGVIVTNDIVPSGFCFDATRLFHSPKSNQVSPAASPDRPSDRHVDVAERRVAIVRRQLPARRRPFGGTVNFGARRRSARAATWPPRPGVRPPRLAVEQHFEQLASERPEHQLPRVGVRQDDGAHVLVGQEHHVASCSQSGCRRGARPARPTSCRPSSPMPYVVVLADRDLRARRRTSSGASCDVARAVGQRARASSIAHVPQHVADVAPGAAGRTHRHDRVVHGHRRRRRACRRCRARAGAA